LCRVPDRCDVFELWQGARCVVPVRAPIDHSLRELSIWQQHQEAVLRYEEAIQASEWAIGTSQRLLKRLEEMRTNIRRYTGWPDRHPKR